MLVGWARSVLDGFWGPDIYSYSLTADEKMLITKGIYSRSRHPVYFGEIMMATGTWLVANSWWFIIFASAVLLIYMWRARREDQDLMERFPEEPLSVDQPDYFHYRRTTRFMIPVKKRRAS